MYVLLNEKADTRYLHVCYIFVCDVMVILIVDLESGFLLSHQFY